MLSTENNSNVAPGHVSNRAKIFGQTGHASRSVLGDIGNTSSRNASSKTAGKPSQAKKIKQSGTSTFQRNAEPAPMVVDTFSSLPPGVENIDLDDHENPLLVAEYVTDIYEYMRELEEKYNVADNHLSHQKDVTEKMRSILIDWLVEVHLRFKLLQETLYLTVHVINRFLACHKVARNKLQLVGITSMLIASKYEEMYPPEVGDFVYIADNAYSRREILNMEALILRKLDFSLGQPLALHFLRRASRAVKADAQTHTMAKFIMETTLQNYNMCNTVASLVAASSLKMSLDICKSGTWNKTVEHYSGYKADDLNSCITNISGCLKKIGSGKLQAVKNKYGQKKFMEISKMPGLQKYF